MSKFIPWRDRCAMECGRRKAPDKQVCWNCYRRGAGRQGPSGPMEKPSSEDRPLDPIKHPGTPPPKPPEPSDEKRGLYELHLTPDQEDELRRAMLKYPAGEVLRKLPGYEPPEPTDMDEIGGIGL